MKPGYNNFTLFAAILITFAFPWMNGKLMTNNVNFSGFHLVNTINYWPFYFMVISPIVGMFLEYKKISKYIIYCAIASVLFSLNWYFLVIPLSGTFKNLFTNSELKRQFQESFSFGFYLHTIISFVLLHKIMKENGQLAMIEGFFKSKGAENVNPNDGTFIEPQSSYTESSVQSGEVQKKQVVAPNLIGKDILSKVGFNVETILVVMVLSFLLPWFPSTSSDSENTLNGFKFLNVSKYIPAYFLILIPILAFYFSYSGKSDLKYYFIALLPLFLVNLYYLFIPASFFSKASVLSNTLPSELPKYLGVGFYSYVLCAGVLLFLIIKGHFSQIKNNYKNLRGTDINDEKNIQTTSESKKYLSIYTLAIFVSIALPFYKYFSQGKTLVIDDPIQFAMESTKDTAAFKNKYLDKYIEIDVDLSSFGRYDMYKSLDYFHLLYPLKSDSFKQIKGFYFNIEKIYIPNKSLDIDSLYALIPNEGIFNLGANERPNFIFYSRKNNSHRLDIYLHDLFSNNQNEGMTLKEVESISRVLSTDLYERANSLSVNGSGTIKEFIDTLYYRPVNYIDYKIEDFPDRNNDLDQPLTLLQMYSLKYKIRGKLKKVEYETIFSFHKYENKPLKCDLYLDDVSLISVEHIFDKLESKPLSIINDDGSQANMLLKNTVSTQVLDPDSLSIEQRIFLDSALYKKAGLNDQFKFRPEYKIVISDKLFLYNDYFFMARTDSIIPKGSRIIAHSKNDLYDLVAFYTTTGNLVVSYAKKKGLIAEQYYRGDNEDLHVEAGQNAEQ